MLFFIKLKIFLAVTSELKKNRLPRLVIPLDKQVKFVETRQGYYDGEVTWWKCSENLRKGDAVTANEHKNYLEEAQRAKVAMRGM